MKTILIKVLMLVVAAAAYNVSALAQQENGSNRIPDGKWVLEGIDAFEENVQVPYNVDNTGIEVPTEIDIQLNDIVFIYKEVTEKVEYNAVVDANSLCFPVCARWKITENKLLLQWEQDIDSPSGNMKMQTIILSYVRE